ncbi:MAG: LysR family transcriptional regulator [Pseudomonadota bacterium]
MAVNLKQLEAFVVVADLGSFRRAAERLNTTQPNISARIAALEALLGLTLMERDAGSVRLTPKGEALLAHARRVLGEVDAFIAATGEEALFDGTIRLGVTEVVAHVWLGRFLKALNARYPNVLVELNVDFSATLSEGLFSRALDLTFQSGPFDRQISGAEGLADYPMIWVAAPGFGLAGRRLGLEEVTAHPILTGARATLLHQQLRAHLAEAGIRGARVAPSTNLAACIQMAIDGLGLACVPEVMAADALASGDLEQLDYPWAPDALSFQARYDAERAPVYVREAARLAAAIARGEDQEI